MHGYISQFNECLVQCDHAGDFALPADGWSLLRCKAHSSLVLEPLSSGLAARKKLTEDLSMSRPMANGQCRPEKKKTDVRGQKDEWTDETD